MPFKVSFFWKQQSSLEGGWSENYWNSLTTMDLVEAKANDLRFAAQFAKGGQPFNPQVRISDTTKFRTTRVVLYPGAGPGANSPAFDADYPTTKALLRLRSAALLSTTQWFGGLRDRDVTNSGNWLPAPGSVTNFNTYFALLIDGANGWSVRVLDPAVLPVNILTIVDATGLVTVAANTIADKSRVRIKGVRGMTKANGIWIVNKQSDTTFLLNGWVPTGQVMTKGNPTMRFQSYIFQAIAQASIVRTTSHRVGKPTGLLGGRRRKRAS